ncbi:MAG: protein-glutamine gamma-glutamyltransferase [Thermoplasmata archaeon]|jgi:transglutaminase-like putative cysteine protease|nr:protein-glutamine gamma-glutamyltransferase [Thermoplasmata archaeon]
MLSGCALLDELQRPGYHVRATMPEEAGWNTDARFQVATEEAVEIRITADAQDGRHVERSGVGDVTLEIPDGVWDVSYTVGGYDWKSYEGLRYDTTPPTITGLELVGNARDGAYTLGQGATIQGHVALAVIDLQTGQAVATTLPHLLTNLPDGLQTYLVSARDEAGNVNNLTVQVRVGSAVDLPAGQHTFGVVARYTNRVQLWDLANLKAYQAPAAARAATGAAYLGAGYAITPDDDAVKNVVAAHVDASMTTAEAALALFRYMAENLEYDEGRLDNTFILTPRQTLLDTEDEAGRDCADPKGPAAECDGIVQAGAGNGVRGGICRDLAAAYVSLLRAAGIPARLVSGYVGGEVNGFHAWVEFHGGLPGSPSPWVPVDVSSIDGPYSDSVMLQSFGISLPEYLPLRDVPPDGEKAGWSTALGVRYEWPPSQPEPKISFEKAISEQHTEQKVLCFNPQTRARAVAQQSSSCGSGYGFYLGGFTTATTRTIDYGILVQSAPPGTEVVAQVAYPFPDAAAPNQVDYQFYGKPFTKDTEGGKAIARFAAP